MREILLYRLVLQKFAQKKSISYCVCVLFIHFNFRSSLYVEKSKSELTLLQQNKTFEYDQKRENRRYITHSLLYYDCIITLLCY